MTLFAPYAEQIFTTPDHPFYMHGEWIPAGHLEVGDEILKADGTVGIVESLEVALEPTEMYNLTVDVVHTFAVGEGEWVVHNCGGSDWKDELLKNRRVKKPDGADLDLNTMDEYSEYLEGQLVTGSKRHNKQMQFDSNQAHKHVYEKGSLNIAEDDGYWYMGYSSKLDNTN